MVSPRDRRQYRCRILFVARQAKAAVNVDEIVGTAQTVGDLRVVSYLLPEAPAELLMTLVDEVASKLGEGLVLLASTAEGKVTLVCKASDGAVAAGAHAGEVVKEVATRCSGGGGGKPSFARAGGKDPAQAAEAVASVAGIVAKQVG